MFPVSDLDATLVLIGGIMMTSKRILVADDSETSRTALTKYLASQQDLEVCGEAVDGEDTIAKAWELKPDLILLDVAMPRTNGIVAASVLKDLCQAFA